ncbi:hypothetical protein K402DRAFT_388357, partial [Aulographum hederae CBS 113979]
MIPLSADQSPLDPTSPTVAELPDLSAHIYARLTLEAVPHVLDERLSSTYPSPDALRPGPRPRSLFVTGQDEVKKVTVHPWHGRKENATATVSGFASSETRKDLPPLPRSEQQRRVQEARDNTHPRWLVLTPESSQPNRPSVSQIQPRKAATAFPRHQPNKYVHSDPIVPRPSLRDRGRGIHDQQSPPSQSSRLSFAPDRSASTPLRPPRRASMASPVSTVFPLLSTSHQIGLHTAVPPGTTYTTFLPLLPLALSESMVVTPTVEDGGPGARGMEGEREGERKGEQREAEDKELEELMAKIKVAFSGQSTIGKKEILADLKDAVKKSG